MSMIEKINKVLAKSTSNLKLNKSNMDKTIKELGLDSLELMEIIVQIEEEFKITLDDEKLVNLKTPNDLIKLVESTLNK
ncbi:acyl carrier protein [Malacoplasma muris]|mgnify:CR=1 FL=1|uniref:acyl carrier protein n=1 Tax=Malacoplasma muris TaxID=2119 RepID=UPI00398F517F